MRALCVNPAIEFGDTEVTRLSRSVTARQLVGFEFPLGGLHRHALLDYLPRSGAGGPESVAYLADSQGKVMDWSRTLATSYRAHPREAFGDLVRQIERGTR